MTTASSPASPPEEIGLDQIEAARLAVERIAVHTPVYNCRVLTELTGSRVVLKAENLQRTGSFKIRGASAKLAALGDGAWPGIVVASAGNHAQAAAFAARSAGVPCEVYMPAEASISKADATIGYGASVHLEGDSLDDCVILAEARAKETGLHFVHPFDDPAIVAGQGTLGLELVRDVDDLAMVIVPLGGGGLVSGIACAIDACAPHVRVVAVQAAVCAPFLASQEAGKLVGVAGGTTLADGIAVKRPTGITIGLIERHVDEIVAVGENEIADAIVMLLMRSKLVVEGAGAVGAAALMEGRDHASGVRHDGGGAVRRQYRHRPALARHPPARDERGAQGRALRPDLRPAREPRQVVDLHRTERGEPGDGGAPARGLRPSRARDGGAHRARDAKP